ncbi:MAG: 6-phosphogluconolactonase/glucosamine-6-phosphate isomerase/deaminase [Bacteroidia bacterium]|jgi:6-phosphogluconolactonase/glucosamine-6-phosphate isomerase/deaminase
MKKSRRKESLDIVPEYAGPYVAPSAEYFHTKETFDEAVGLDFIRHANEGTRKGEKFLAGLSHGTSPSGAYQYILDHYDKLSRPENIRYTFVNSKLSRQRGMSDVTDAISFLKQLLASGKITKDQILGRSLNRDNMEEYSAEMNTKLSEYLKLQDKEGLDYMFIATDTGGRVAGITRFSDAFDVKEIGCIVTDRKEKELTLTPYFITKTKRIAFLATKAEKRRALARLYYRWGKADESPSFLRFMDKAEERLKVFIDDRALTWPKITLERETPYGASRITVDLPKPYKEFKGTKLPVVVLVHGFLGLNSYDGLLTAIPTKKYIAAAMHYGSVPNDLPIKEYSNHIVRNIDKVIAHFGELGHPVYLFDHSMGNIYFMMMEQMFDELPGIQKYLKGRIGANPFFGEEAKHAFIGFLDNVILPSGQGIAEKSVFYAARHIVPWDSNVGVRNRGISMSKWLISKESSIRERVWKATKARILTLMSSLGSLPHLNRIPIERALNRLPAKIFVIQTHSALIESKKLDKQTEFPNMEAHNIPILILKSERDGVAKYVSRVYDRGHAQVIDITDKDERDLFREHLYHMVNPLLTTVVIDQFISQIEASESISKSLRKVAV